MQDMQSPNPFFYLLSMILALVTLAVVNLVVPQIFSVNSVNDIIVLLFVVASWLLPLVGTALFAELSNELGDTLAFVIAVLSWIMLGIALWLAPSATEWWIGG